MPKTAEPSETATAEAAQSQSVFELLDEVIRIDRSTLIKILAFCVAVLLLISGTLVYQEVAAGRNHLAVVYGGFFVLVLGLIASVVFVLHEASQLEVKDEKKTD
ncbi:unnamed protein product [Durusdinium trenchii]|uniref:Uncharacterized protein n=1 Tax=Durusdinium trenchii TaxID=1381693 RepID=A0ABP0H9G4_9DINO